VPGRDVALSIVDWGGTGPLALLAHATGFCADSLCVIAERLRSRFHVLGYDARGHGDSDKPAPPAPYEWLEFAHDVSAVSELLLKELGQRSFAVALGHSFGGTCLMHAAGRHADRFERLVLLDPVIVPPPADDPTADPLPRGPFYAADIARKRTHVFPSRDALRARWKEKGTFSDWDPRALEGYLAHGFHDRPDGQIELACPGLVEAAVYEAGQKFDAWKAAASLTRPALLLHALKGNFPRALVDRLAARAPAVELRSLELPHLMAMTDPDEVADEFLGWLP
jgi:lipase